MQVIEDYSFGHIKICGKSYSNDVIIFTEEVLPNWRRKEGHNLRLEDLKEVMKRKPKIFIIGTGFYGVMKVSKNLIKELENMGLKIIVKNSKEAIHEFNHLVEEKHRVAMGIHLTC